MSKKKLTSLVVCGNIHVDLTGRIVAVDCPEYSAHTKVTFYSPETRGSEGQCDSMFRTVKVLAYDWIVSVNCSNRIQSLYWNEKDR
jgi:hypothetical protein